MGKRDSLEWIDKQMACEGTMLQAIMGFKKLGYTDTEISEVLKILLDKMSEA